MIRGCASLPTLQLYNVLSYIQNIQNCGLQNPSTKSINSSTVSSKSETLISLRHSSITSLETPCFFKSIRQPLSSMRLLPDDISLKIRLIISFLLTSRPLPFCISKCFLICIRAHNSAWLNSYVGRVSLRTRRVNTMVGAQAYPPYSNHSILITPAAKSSSSVFNAYSSLPLRIFDFCGSIHLFFSTDKTRRRSNSYPVL